MSKNKKYSVSVDDAAELLQNAKSIIILAGAGVSVAAGIPDFRSPGTGLYYNLQQFSLPYPTAVFDLDYFKQRPRPFFALQKDLFPSIQYHPTFTHAFFRYLDKQNKLQLLVTQNIDGLDQRAGISSEKLITAHGSFSKPTICPSCHKEYDILVSKAASFDNALPICSCGSVLKPQIVFFSEPVYLPENKLMLALKSDVCLVIGTSLNVGPVNQIPQMACGKLLLINKEIVGEDQGIEWNNVLQGECDDICKQLCQKMKCIDEVTQLYEDIKEEQEKMKDCFLDEKQKNDVEKHLELVALGGELIIPTSQQVIVDKQKYMLALSSDYNIKRLQDENCKETKINIGNTLIPAEFMKYIKDNSQIRCFSKQSGYGHIYKPIDGHYSSYVYKFNEYYVDDQKNKETDLWDIISRYAQTKVGDNVLSQNIDGKQMKIDTDIIEKIETMQQQLLDSEKEQVENDNKMLLLKDIMKLRITTTKSRIPANMFFQADCRVEILCSLKLGEKQKLEDLPMRMQYIQSYIDQQIMDIIKIRPNELKCFLAGQDLCFVADYVFLRPDQVIEKAKLYTALEQIFRKCWPEIVETQLL